MLSAAPRLLHARTVLRNRSSFVRPATSVMTFSAAAPLAAVSQPGSAEADGKHLRYKPFAVAKKGDAGDWVDGLELDTVQRMSAERGKPIKVLVLYGSLRERSFSRLTAYEASRILTRLGADVRVFDPLLLPVKGACPESHEKVVELRELSAWSDAHMWVSPEQHGTITAVMKNQIDWIPLSTGSVRPTQGRTLAVCQVNGGSQSFNTVNVLRQLGRWMRMFTIPNQSSIPKAWTQYDESDRLLPSSNRDRLVDVCEELIKVTILLQPSFDLLGDRYSEREEKREHGRLRTQAEVETTLKKM
ncbi:hypothetical protein BMF94_1263 [Rhodotorula taiwanensis]|uniref:NADPH-dependent FMN reductase-like domain-containing protein n=1 Tax=Rhodotorula taiwanensis TaxID=741276 RepID=A0A2S5BFV7_9BASI|nr:hypothetical protein BMF94_1263 [Rhodotorula taiwanensis]